MCDNIEIYNKSGLIEYCQDLSGFLQRNTEWIKDKEKMLELQKRKQELLVKKMAGVKMYQNESLILLSYQGDENKESLNNFQNESNGMIIHFEKNKLRVKHHGLNKMDKTVYDEDYPLLSFHLFNSQIRVSSSLSFEKNSEHKILKSLLKKKNFNSHFLQFYSITLQYFEKKIYLVSLRSKLTNKIESYQFLAKYAKYYGLSTFENN